MNINLAVPFFSQRDNSYVWKQRYENDVTDTNTKKILYKKGSPVTDSSGKEKTVKIWDYCCNITCLAMVLNFPSMQNLNQLSFLC